MKPAISSLVVTASTLLFFSPSIAFADSPEVTTLTSPERLLDIVANMEKTWEDQYRNHLDRNFSTSIVTPQKVEQNLRQARETTNTRAAFIWLNAYPDYLAINISTENQTKSYSVKITRTEILDQAQQLIQFLSDPALRSENQYLPPAQKLYQWLLQPISPFLISENIDSLIFCPGKGLRTIPFAALHDGENFLIETYAVSRLPAFSLTDMNPNNNLQNSEVLAMGASEFEDLISLPAVPIELNTIATQIGTGRTFLNQDFTLNNLADQMTRQSFKIVHLATHAKIEPGKPKNSYIQFWDEQLNLDQFPALSEQRWWSDVELLVLSACETAVINEENQTLDEEVEMSFAGLALQAGVKASIASSWDISDQGTLELMTQFYQQLRTAPTKTIALQKAQLALLNQTVSLSTESQSFNLQNSLSHPYFWATFTVIGNPW